MEAAPLDQRKKQQAIREGQHLSERPARVRGKTVIDDEVVSVISRIAAEEVAGVHSIGDFDSIEQAVKQLPAQGGRICVLPGVHKTQPDSTQPQQHSYYRLR